MAFMSAGGIKLRDPLKQPLGAIGAQRQSSLQDALGGITERSRASQMASGRPQGQYTGQALGMANTLASRGIDDSLYGLIGEASYGEDRADRDHLRMVSLAKKYGNAMKPSTMQEILGGVGAIGGAIAPGLANYRSYQNRALPQGGGSNPLSLNSYSEPDPSLMSMDDPYWWMDQPMSRGR